MPVLIELEGLTATAYVDGTASEGSKGRLAWSYRATGIRPANGKPANGKEAA